MDYFPYYTMEGGKKSIDRMDFSCICGIAFLCSTDTISRGFCIILYETILQNFSDFANKRQRYSVFV